jgi:cytochrome P450 PksS
MSTTIDLPFWSAEFKRSSYESYAHLRAEQPVCQVELPNRRSVWLVTRYDDVMATLKDPRFIKDWRTALSEEERAKIGPVPESVRLIGEHMLSFDPPRHTRLRALVSKAFTPRYIEQLRPRIQQIADGLIDAVQARGHMDLIDEFAFPLPITVIAEMLGVPAEDRGRFRTWSDAVIAGEPAADRLERLGVLMDEFTDYLRGLFEQRRASPGPDLISGLLAAEEQGDRLSERELFGMVFLLLIAGHETTVNLIGNGMLALLTHPDQLALLRERPELVETAVEEFLRYDGPVETSTMRFATEDVEIGGALIPRGSSVLVVLGSANRDGQRFGCPHQLDITRADNRHVAFGYGIHYCLGAPLARLEGQVAFATLLRRLPGLRLAAPLEELAWRPSMIVRGLRGLPVEF